MKPFREADLLPAIETARARHDELAEVRAEAESLADALAARKRIERAKGLLMEKEGSPSATPSLACGVRARSLERPLAVVADALIATFESSSGTT